MIGVRRTKESVDKLVVALGLCLLVGVSPAGASETPTSFEEALDLGFRTVSEVNSVSELTDVDPNSWAFQALKSVVERFGCLEGYPNKTFAGNRHISRYEFAAGLNACLSKANELITAGTADKATKEDLATLQRLQDDFSNELIGLRGRTDALETKTKAIEAKLFSTTAKLDGTVIMAITGASAGSGNVRLPSRTPPVFGDSDVARSNNDIFSFGGNSANVSFVTQTTLNIRATFSGEDELLVRMRGVTGQSADAAFPNISGDLGTLFYGSRGSFPGLNRSGRPLQIPDARDNTSFDGSTNRVLTNGAASVTFDKVRYLFPVGPVRIFLGPRIDLFEVIDTNSFANNEEVDFSNGFFLNNALTRVIFTGPGLGFDWAVSQSIALRAVYIAATGGSVSAFGNSGLFGGNTALAAELEFDPSSTSAIKLQYARYTEEGRLYATPFINVRNAITDVVGANVEWAITPEVGIFGRLSFAYSNAYFSSSTTAINSSSWMAGLSFPRPFSIPGTFAFAVGQVPRVNFVSSSTVSTTNFLPSSREIDFEAFYNFPISDRLTITPDIQFIFDAGNIGNPTIGIYTLRTVFSF
jgi:Carbohydrate-selective porin, OprB family/S-layer homology domain